VITSPIASSPIGRRFGRQRQPRHAGDEAEHEPAQDEQDRIRDAERLRERYQASRRGEQRQEHELVVRAEGGGQRRSHSSSRWNGDDPTCARAAASRRACSRTHARWRCPRPAYLCFQ